MVCTVVITILTSAFADAIIASMVHKGYRVSPVVMANDGLLTIETNGTLGEGVCFLVESVGGDTNVNAVKKAVMSVLEEHKISYFSVMVVLGVACDWALGNIPRTTAEVVPTSWERLSSTEEIP